MNRQQKDPAKDATLWAAIRALDEGNRRGVADSSGEWRPGGPSWHEKDARKILFLKHRYDAGEWHGPADRPRPARKAQPAAARA